MQLKLISKHPEEGNVISFAFEKPADFEYKPGQFLKYTLPDSKPDKRGVNRFFTNSAAPFENKIQISTRIEAEKPSTFKLDLANLNPGDTIEADGPKGMFVFDDPQKKSIFIAGGIGITPFRSILLQLDHDKQPLNITLIYAARDKDTFFHNEFNALAAKHPEFKIFYLISEAEQRAERPFVSDENTQSEKISENVEVIQGKIDQYLIKKLVPDFKDYIFYTSGPEPMVEDLEKKLADMGIAGKNSVRDYFPGYTKY